jgi:hypothetical protein
LANNEFDSKSADPAKAVVCRNERRLRLFVMVGIVFCTI